jgi:hypothetical protein
MLVTGHVLVWMITSQGLIRDAFKRLKNRAPSNLPPSPKDCDIKKSKLWGESIGKFPKSR